MFLHHGIEPSEDVIAYLRYKPQSELSFAKILDESLHAKIIEEIFLQKGIQSNYVQVRGDLKSIFSEVTQSQDRELLKAHFAEYVSKSYPSQNFNPAKTLENLRNPDMEFNPENSKFYSTLSRASERPSFSPAEIKARIQDLASRDEAMAQTLGKIYQGKSYERLPPERQYIIR